MFLINPDNMTVEKMLPYPMAAHPQQMAMFDNFLAVHTQQRNRHNSGGSTGSYGSTSSYERQLTERQMPQLSPELVYQLAQMQNSVARVAQQQQQQQHNRQRQQQRLDNAPADRSVQNHGKNINPTRYKTEMCRPYEENGYCKYGEKCQFAHGSNEQRSLSRHPKYKTDLCRTYHSVGFCPYGPRCHFIHNEDEHKLHEIIQMKQQLAYQQVADQVAQQQVFSRLQQNQVQKPTESLVPQQPTVSRPTNLDFSSLSLQSLGSTIDTPPSSVTNSPPSLSPVSMLGDEVFTSLPTPPPGFTAPPSLSNVFNFQDLPKPQVARSGNQSPMSTSSMSPLSMSSSSEASPLDINVANLAAGLQAASLNSGATRVLRECLEDLLSTPPSPPLSVDENNTESPFNGNCRLPIFSQFSIW